MYARDRDRGRDRDRDRKTVRQAGINIASVIILDKIIIKKKCEEF